MSDNDIKNKISLFPDTLIIVGGGRWAKVYVEILDELLSVQSEIIICSPTQYHSLVGWVKESNQLGRTVSVVTDLKEQIGSKNIGAAIVVNQSSHHVATTSEILKASIPVLVEKPVATQTNEALELYALSRSKRTVLAAGHVFQFSSYLIKLAMSLNTLSDLKRLVINWSDPDLEIRYGETKSFDYAAPIIHDIMPHIYAICRHFVIDAPLYISEVRVKHGGRHVELVVKANQVVIEVRLERCAEKRQRLLHLELQDEGIELDFTKEPGTIKRGGKQYSAEPGWENEISPLRKQLITFFGAIEEGAATHRTHGRDYIECATLIENATKEYEKQNINFIRNEMSRFIATEKISEDIYYVLREFISLSLRNESAKNDFKNETLSILINSVWECLVGQNEDAKIKNLVVNNAVLRELMH